eukprot:TRINITY_DN74681_c0_g1_i1.p1 TRINITY_DN74681_c0_g1~~TRINITY_DN74681_c0_g1_i1.p1  ORF type:complete len:169 (+),score=14.85 TRINITY_DN74681_c0_g1_i1:770-1276(+)
MMFGECTWFYATTLHLCGWKSGEIVAWNTSTGISWDNNHYAEVSSCPTCGSGVIHVRAEGGWSKGGTWFYEWYLGLSSTTGEVLWQTQVPKKPAWALIDGRDRYWLLVETYHPSSWWVAMYQKGKLMMNTTAFQEDYKWDGFTLLPNGFVATYSGFSAQHTDYFCPAP